MILSDELRRHHARIIKDDADVHRCMLFLRMFVSLLITSLVPILSLAKRTLIRLGQALPTTMMPSMPPGPSLESACERACVCIAILMARHACGVDVVCISSRQVTSGSHVSMAESRTYRNGRRDSFKKVISVGNGFHARFLLGLGHCLERAHDDKPKCPAIGGPSAHAPAFGYDNVSSVVITSATRFSFTNKSDMIK